MHQQPASRGAAVPLIAAALAIVYLAGRLLPGLGHDGHLAVRWWGGFALYGAAAALCLLRARADARERTAWTLLGAGILAYGLGSVAGFVSDRPDDDPPAIAYVAWLSFFALVYPALLLMLRARLRPFTLSFCLDGALGGLTVATLSAALVGSSLAGIEPLKAVAGLTFPCADLVLLFLLLWACAMTGWRSSQLWVMAAGFALAAVGDIVEDVAVARGTFHILDWSTACFPLAMLLIGVSAWRPAPPQRPMRTDARAVLAMPAVCVVASLIVLVAADGETVPQTLAVVTLLVALARAALTFAELGKLHEARRFARGFEEAAIGMAFVSVPDLTWRRVNATLAAMVGVQPADLVGRPVDTDDRSWGARASRANLQRLLAGEPQLPYVRRTQRPDGTAVDLEITSVLVEGDDGQPMVFSQIQDVTVARRTARHNAALAELSRVALEQREAGALIDEVCALLRDTIPADGVELEAASPDDAVSASGRMISAPMRPRNGLPATLVAHRDASHAPFIEAHARFLEAAANVLGTALDRAAVEEELRTQALEDPLTGLANRSYLAAHVEQAIAGAQRSEDHISLLLLDLDRFKVVNDTLGHGAGDELLCAVADRLRSTIRRGDLAARLGGDEFVVVCAGAGGAPHEVAALSSRLLEAVAAPYVVDGRELHISASAGLVFVDGPGVTAESLLRDADVAMYRAKDHGGARYELFDAGLRARVVQRLTVEGELRVALERDELSLRVQPIVDLHRDEIAGFEALVRWEHPERGTIAPAEFISIAEETGLIVPIGKWVLNEALRWLAELQDAAGRPLRMSVNLSARQLAPELVVEVGDALAASGIAPRHLTLEVTETLIVDGRGSVEVLEAMRALGVAIAIDDFGTGWSSLGALQRHPVDVLKLDRSLVAPAGASDAAAALARAVVEMAQALGLEVIAEGIEDAEQLAAMRALGCPHGQGYVFARPMPLADALSLVAPGGTPATARAASVRGA